MLNYAGWSEINCWLSSFVNLFFRGTSGRYLSRGVLQMTPGSILPQPCGDGGEGGDGKEGEVISEAQRQLKELLKKQLDTSDVTVKGWSRSLIASSPGSLSFHILDCMLDLWTWSRQWSRRGSKDEARTLIHCTLQFTMIVAPSWCSTIGLPYIDKV